MELREGTGVWDGDTQVARLEVTESERRDVVGVFVLTPLTLGLDRALELVDALAGAGETKADGPPLLFVYDELVRYAARTAGWTGGLRQLLTRPGAPASGLGLLPHAPDQQDGDPRLRAIAELLPGTDVRRVGFNVHKLTIRATRADGGTRIRVRVPDRDDLMPEVIASAIDTALAVKRRFGRMASGVRAMAFDHGGGQFADGSISGLAQGATGTIFLNSNLAFADAMVDERRRQADQGRHGVGTHVSPPFTSLEAVTAHEMWHNLDAGMQSTPRVYFEFNRALGEELGVTTFEYALRGGEASAPPEWRVARRRIVEEVSNYATTNMREATAEMFMKWWCSPPEAQLPPLVRRFGELVDEYYPPS